MNLKRVVLAAVAAATLLAPVLAAETPAGATTWACTKTDNGSQNPGGACGAYKDASITNSDGYNTYVGNDVWNAPGAGNPQTIYVDNPGDWEVTAKYPVGNTAVLSYPDIQDIFTTANDEPAPLSGFSTIFSDPDISQPAASVKGDFEAAYDMWFQTSGSSAAQEIMLWIDNHGQVPAGKAVATVVFYGQTWTVWSNGAKLPLISLVLDKNQTSGRIHILAISQWLESKGYVPAGSGVSEINFGWELCSTNGQLLTFKVTGYDLRAGCSGGGTSCF
jgi:glycosyl hydrolase family 12